MKTFADQIRPFIPKRYYVLGTDGFGRSDTREQLRSFFEVDRYYISIAALKALSNEEQIPVSQVEAAIRKYNINPEKPSPTRV
jgi:pyruvate dehydrogenase E1 component